MGELYLLIDRNILTLDPDYQNQNYVYNVIIVMCNENKIDTSHHLGSFFQFLFLLRFSAAEVPVMLSPVVWHRTVNCGIQM